MTLLWTGVHRQRATVRAIRHVPIGVGLASHALRRPGEVMVAALTAHRQFDGRAVHHGLGFIGDLELDWQPVQARRTSSVETTPARLVVTEHPRWPAQTHRLRGTLSVRPTICSEMPDRDDVGRAVDRDKPRDRRGQDPSNAIARRRPPVCTAERGRWGIR